MLEGVGRSLDETVAAAVVWCGVNELNTVTTTEIGKLLGSELASIITDYLAANTIARQELA